MRLLYCPDLVDAQYVRGRRQRQQPAINFHFNGRHRAPLMRRANMELVIMILISSSSSARRVVVEPARGQVRGGHRDRNDRDRGRGGGGGGGRNSDK